MKYLGINIGPIIKTFSMARKPKEFWAASYMFSYLMECILDRFQRENVKIELISPFYEKDENQRIGVGLFPDRAFYMVKHDIDVNALLSDAVKYFSGRIKMNEDVVNRFFNIMTVSQEYQSSSEAIAGLNKTLDEMELSQVAWNSGTYDKMLDYLRKSNTNSPLFEIAFNRNYFPIETLDEIARGNANQIDYSYQRYVCIVQADGDNMGKIVSSKHMEGKLNDFSSHLIFFGVKVCKKINNFGGLPIYAGGDDLLFIAPVCGAGNKNILELIEEIDREYREIQIFVNKLNVEVENNEHIMEPVQTSMSYGISIIYNKYPLYEAWEIARNMLFAKAKNISGKNSIALNLRKNSGSDFQMVMQKSSEIYYKLDDLIRFTPKETLVSAVAHKIRANTQVLSVLPKEEPFTGLNERLNAFYEKTIETETKSEKEVTYLLKTKETLELIYKSFFIEKKKKEEEAKRNKKTFKKTTLEQDMETIISTCYSILRIAKFIKGEEVKDE